MHTATIYNYIKKYNLLPEAIHNIIHVVSAPTYTCCAVPLSVLSSFEPLIDMVKNHILLVVYRLVQHTVTRYITAFLWECHVYLACHIMYPIGRILTGAQNNAIMLYHDVGDLLEYIYIYIYWVIL